MTIQVPKTGKSKAQLAMEKAIAGADSISLSLRRALDGAGKALTQETGVTQISQISPDLGDMTSGAFWALDEQGRPRMVMSAASLFEEMGVAAYFAGFDVSGQPQFWVDADTGEAVYAGGAGVIGRNGWTLSGLRYALEQYASRLSGGYPRKGRVEMVVPEGGASNASTTPEWRFRFFDATAQAELLTNGDFAAGDTSGWTTDLGTGSTFAAVAKAGGGYEGKLHRATYPALAKISGVVTAGKRYRIKATVRGDNDGAAGGIANVIAYARFYDSGNNLVGYIVTLAEFNEGASINGEIILYSRTIEPTLAAPAGATSVQLWFSANDGVGNAYISDVSLQESPAIDHNITFSDSGVNLNGSPIRVVNWGSALEAGPNQNRNVSSAYTTQIMVLKVFETMRVTAAKWDVRTAGSYQLHKLYGPNISSSIRQLWSGTVAAPGEVNMPFGSPEVLLPGTYYLGLTSTGGAVNWWDYNSGTWLPATNPDFVMDGIYYNTTGYGFVPGARLVRQRSIWA